MTFILLKLFDTSLPHNNIHNDTSTYKRTPTKNVDAQNFGAKFGENLKNWWGANFQFQFQFQFIPPIMHTNSILQLKIMARNNQGVD